MGTAIPTMGTLVNKGGYNPEVQVRGSHAAHTWHAGRGTGQGWGDKRTCRTGAPLRVGKGHHDAFAGELQGRSPRITGKMKRVRKCESSSMKKYSTRRIL